MKDWRGVGGRNEGGEGGGGGKKREKKRKDTLSYVPSSVPNAVRILTHLIHTIPL